MKRPLLITLMTIILALPSMYGQKYGQDSLACIENLSLYRINYKIWKDHNFEERVIQEVPIYTPWHWVFFNCPESSQNIYVDGVTILKYIIDKEKNQSIRQQYIDTLMMVYDQRIKYFGSSNTSREGLVLGRKGVDLYTLSPDRFFDAFQILNKSIELEGLETTGPVLVYYFNTTINSAVKGAVDSSVIIDTYDKISEIIDYNIEKNKDNPEQLTEWENVKANIESTFEPFATCDDLLSIYEKKFKLTPDNVDLLKKITRILDKKNCTNSDLFFEATKKLYDLEPTPESGYLMGVMNLRKEKFQEASTYLFASVDSLKDVNKKSNTYLLLANIYLNLNDFPKARSFAYKGLEIKPDNGSFYILIGDLYARSAIQCGDNDLTKKVAYWAAVDKYIKAKNVDNTVTDNANERISTYSSFFPSTETIFFYDLKEGDPYSVGCWINESTTVRASK
ncbi:MAG: hypothetical protein NT175_07925 [Bacteroidetes bacterium]|nr:hypothetical protein [Bacteroidota bacterium]